MIALTTYAPSRRPYAQSVTPDRPTHWNFIISDGPAATQTIFHLHVHLVPRAYDDGLHLPWTGQAKV